MDINIILNSFFEIPSGLHTANIAKFQQYNSKFQQYNNKISAITIRGEAATVSRAAKVSGDRNMVFDLWRFFSTFAG